MDSNRVVFCPLCGTHMSGLTWFCFLCGQTLESETQQGEFVAITTRNGTSATSGCQNSCKSLLDAATAAASVLLRSSQLPPPRPSMSFVVHQIVVNYVYLYYVSVFIVTKRFVPSDYSHFKMIREHFQIPLIEFHQDLMWNFKIKPHQL
ncbi:hypothetical protein GOODEAATRI_034191 [Goodea atripinnis]|uniref:Uncharacterized protein n=1 Tax=Goodea atripinnis TaxID=208336 RepID=A0ABV0PTZ9_9TELE